MDFENNMGQESERTQHHMSFGEIEALLTNGKCNDIEVGALKMQAQMRMEHLRNQLFENGDSRIPTFDNTRFQVDLDKKQVIEAVLL